MPFCRSCGTGVSEEVKFCPKCGQRLIKGEAPSGAEASGLGTKADGVYQEQAKFKSVNGLAKWVIWIFVVLAVVDIIAILSGFAEASLLNRIMAGETVTWSEAVANDERQAVIGVVQFLLYVASAVAFLIWVYRTNKNLRSLRTTDLRFTSGWAVGWFFIPIMNLFRPYQVVSEIWRASDPTVETSDSTSWRSSPTSPIVGLWWAFFLISNFVAWIAVRMLFMGEELPDLLASTYAYMVSDGMDVVYIIVAILMVRRITQLQEEKNRLISFS